MWREASGREGNWSLRKATTITSHNSLPVNTSTSCPLYPASCFSSLFHLPRGSLPIILHWLLFGAGQPSSMGSSCHLVAMDKKKNFLKGCSPSLSLMQLLLCQLNQLFSFRGNDIRGGTQNGHCWRDLWTLFSRITRSTGKAAFLGNCFLLHTSLVVEVCHHTLSCNTGISQSHLCFQRFSSLKGI